MSTIIPPPLPNTHTCSVCHNFFALPEKKLCLDCNEKRCKICSDITRQIQEYEDSFGFSFRRSDDVYVAVRDIEEACIGYIDPTDAMERPFVGHVAEVELKEGDYEVVDDAQIIQEMVCDLVRESIPMFLGNSNPTIPVPYSR